LISLRQAPADSVVLHRSGASILLSMCDVEAHYAQFPLPPDVAQLLDEMRREYREAGWVRLGEGMLPDLLASSLVQSGRAAVRMHPRRRLVPWLRTAREKQSRGTSVITERLFYAPDGTLLLRVLDSIAVS
jgi:hypothetical protein